ncbi:uncharacterized protein LOC110687754 isoform X2 [Chenopodium quinoa]|nr:uncharacterized protein LOC110687754 isoform X2 [Chenopodium quinoa]
MINSDDPQDGDPRADPKEQQSKVLQFGASDNRVKTAGYTTYIENKQKVNNRFLTVSKNEPRMKGDVVQEDPSAQDRSAPDKPVTQQEARSKMLQFGVQEGEGKADYNQCFDNVWMDNKFGNMVSPKVSDAPQLNSDDCKPSKKDSHSMEHKFYWRYTIYSDNDNEYAYSSSDSWEDEETLPDEETFTKARSPLLDEGWISERVRPLDRADDLLSYEEGRRSTVEQSDGIRIASQDLPNSTEGSETSLRKESKSMQMNGDILLHEDPDPPAPADSEARSKVVVPQIGVWEFEREAGCIQWFGCVWKNIKSGLMITPKPPMNYSHNQDNQGRWPDNCSSTQISPMLPFRPCLQSDESGASEESRRLVNNARFPLLDDEELIAERGRPLPKDYGGGMRLTVKQSDDKVIGQTGIASRGFSTSTTGSTTPLQKKSNLMQSNVGATSEEVPNNDSLASRDHLLTDHPNLEKKGFQGEVMQVQAWGFPLQLVTRCFGQTDRRNAK